tara:strand:+ start:8612 stop:9472 length:861 start_codon:yes stop_codon:yes gene_type:complete
LETKPIVSVITPTRNRPDLLEQSVKVLEAGTKLNYEHIIVANDPTPETRELCNRLSKKKNCKIILNESNESYSYSNNQAVEASKGEILCFLNDDVLLENGCLESMIKTMNEREAGIVGTNLFFPDGTIQHVGVLFRSNLLPMHAFYGFDPKFLSGLFGRDSKQLVVTGACLMIKKSLFNKLGGFDERFFYGLEDVDLCLKAKFSGESIWLSGDANGIHHEHASGDISGKPNYKNVLLFYRKWALKLIGKYPRIFIGWRDYKVIDELLSKSSIIDHKIEKRRFWKVF